MSLCYPLDLGYPCVTTGRMERPSLPAMVTKMTPSKWARVLARHRSRTLADRPKDRLRSIGIWLPAMFENTGALSGIKDCHPRHFRIYHAINGLLAKAVRSSKMRSVFGWPVQVEIFQRFPGTSRLIVSGAVEL